MFGLGPATKVYLAAGATDLRKGFDGLYGLARDALGLEPLSGHLVLFCNRDRKQTTFSISMPTLGDPIPVASAVRPEGSRDSTHGPSGQPSGSCGGSSVSVSHGTGHFALDVRILEMS